MRTVKSTKNVLYKFPEIPVRIRSNLNQIKPVFIRSKEIFSNEITLKSLFLIFRNFRNFHNLDKNVLESEFTIFCRFPPNLPKKIYTSYHLSNRIILYGFQENGMYCEILTSSNKKVLYFDSGLRSYESSFQIIRGFLVTVKANYGRPSHGYTIES